MHQPPRTTEFHTEVLCVQCGQKLVRAECLKCTWFAAGSKTAVEVAERAHQWRHAREHPADMASSPA